MNRMVARAGAWVEAPAGLRGAATPPAPEMAAQVDDTLHRGFASLRFPEALERRYLWETAALRRRSQMVAGGIGAFTFSAMLLSDHAMVPDVFGQALVLRLGVFAPACLLAMWFLNERRQTLSQELTGVCMCVLAAAIHIFLCLTSKSAHATAYIAGLVMVLLYWSVFVRVRFWLALPLAMGFMAVFCGLWWGMPLRPLELLVPTGLQLFSTAVFTTYYVYVLEHEERHNYLLGLRQRLLQHQWNEANAQLDQLSRTDALTQLANRRHFDEYLAQAWTQACRERRKLSVLMLDVDHFKRYNDHHGHPAGDACLVQVGQSLAEALRRPGDLVARYGGEEFIAVCRHVDSAQAVGLAERVRAQVEQQALPHGASPTAPVVTVSVGVATLQAGAEGSSAALLIALADAALYQAKCQGRNRVCAAPPGAHTGMSMSQHEPERRRASNA